MAEIEGLFSLTGKRVVVIFSSARSPLECEVVSVGGRIMHVRTVGAERTMGIDTFIPWSAIDLLSLWVEE